MMRSRNNGGVSRRWVRPLLLVLLTLLLPLAPALASDGVLEINQACAVETGCFAGDTAGFPVTITEAGTSYRLTSRLILPDENTDGIVISTNDVGIDLNNFAIIRSGCEGVTTDCTPASGTGSGVKATFTSILGLSVKNGSITGMGNAGVSLGSQAEVTNLRVRWNRLDGIAVAEASTVSGNTSAVNGGLGILAGPGSTVSGNTAFGNGISGFRTLSGATISGNTAYLNQGDGIFTGTGSTVSGNTAYSNGGDGIQAGSGSTVLGNTVRLNTGFGLNLGSQSGYRENVITNNTAGTVNGTGLLNFLNNACDGSTVCP